MKRKREREKKKKTQKVCHYYEAVRHWKIQAAIEFCFYKYSNDFLSLITWHDSNQHDGDTLSFHLTFIYSALGNV